MPGAQLGAQAVDLEVAQMPEADQYFRDLPLPGSLFFHPPQEVRVPSLDRKSPFRPCFAWLVTQPVPSAAENRRRFVHSLAVMDSQALVDGGWLLPLGQEEALRELAAAYRRLPAVRFATLSEGARTAAPPGPVTFRWARVGQAGPWLYVVNDAPFAMTAPRRTWRPRRLPRPASLAGQRHGGAARARRRRRRRGRVDLEPYDLLAVELSEPGVQIAPVRRSAAGRRPRPWPNGSASWACGRPRCAVRRR